MSDSAHPHSAHDHGDHGHGIHGRGEGHDIHVSSTGFYLVILGLLIVLTVVTAWVSFKDFGYFNDVVALGLAFTKASLVVLFFMHVKHSPRIIKFVVVTALAFLSLMLGLTYLDYVSRNAVEPVLVPVASEYQELLDQGYAKASAAEHGADHGDDDHGEDH